MSHMSDNIIDRVLVLHFVLLARRERQRIALTGVNRFDLKLMNTCQISIVLILKWQLLHSSH